MRCATRWLVAAMTPSTDCKLRGFNDACDAYAVAVSCNVTWSRRFTGMLWPHAPARTPEQGAMLSHAASNAESNDIDPLRAFTGMLWSSASARTSEQCAVTLDTASNAAPNDFDSPVSHESLSVLSPPKRVQPCATGL